MKLGQNTFSILKRCVPITNSFTVSPVRLSTLCQAHQASPFHDRLVPPIMACVEGEMDLQLCDWKS